MSSPRVLRRLRFLPLAALLFVTAFSIYVVAEVQYRGVYRTDSMAFTHYASQLWIFPSWNPYGSDLQKALEMFSVDIDYVTLKPDGDFITNLNYPALHLLFFTPFVFLGLQDMRWVTFAFEVAAILILYYWSPEETRPLVLIPFFAGADLSINFTAGCLGDILWVLPLMITALYIESPLISGLSYGLASAVKQEPWILLPFLLTWTWKSTRDTQTKKFRTTGIFLAAAATAFLVPNVPFIIKNPNAWLSDVTTPLSGDLIVVSQGISTLSQTGLLPLSRSFYFTLAASVFLFLLINYSLHFEELKNTLWAFPAVIMWFTPRGLQNYFIYMIPLCLAASVKLYKESQMGEKM